MVESVTMSLALGIIAVVVVTMAVVRALRRRARRSHPEEGDPTYRLVHPNGWDAAESPPPKSENDRARSRKSA